VEPDVPVIQDEIVAEKIKAVSVPLEEIESTPESKDACPQCGSFLDGNERFCSECGYDTSIRQQGDNPFVTEITQPEVEEIISPVIPVEEAVSLPENNLFCPKCATAIDEGEQFCPQCGFNTISNQTPDNINPDPAYVSPVVVTHPPPKPAIPLPATEPAHKPAPDYTQPIKPLSPSNRKKPLLWIVLIGIGIVVLGTAGWFVYNNYLSSPKEATNDTSITMGIPVTPVPEDISAEDAEVEAIEQTESPDPDQAKANKKPVNKRDQELAKQKEKAQNQPSAQQNKPDQPEETSAETTEKNIPSKVIMEVGRKEEPKNKNPKNPVKLTLQKVTVITRITTDHYNNGMGTPRGGTIMIKDHLGINIGNYKAVGKTGKNGTPSAKWIAEPNITLAKGTYYISDSDISTWSKTFLGGNGFVVVEGYEVE
jgi:RNA polymerase subunit RPABC4/transcription elongation factor Spt4